MKENPVPKPGWFQRNIKSGELMLGKDSVKIESGEAVDHSVNENDDYESYREKRRGQRHKLYGQFENQNMISSTRERGSSLIQLRSKPYNPVSETSGVSCLTRDGDCLDKTFDGIERYACKEATGEKFPFGPSKEQQLLHDRFINSEIVEIEKGANHDKNKILACDGYEFEQNSDSSCNNDVPIGFCSSGTSGGGFGFIAEKIGNLLPIGGGGKLDEKSNQSGSDHPKSGIASTATKSLSTTPNSSKSDQALSQNDDGSDLFSDQAAIFKPEQEQQFYFDISPIPINRENSLLDVESPANDEKEKLDRLERLRQNKRAIEKERLGMGQTQTIVIPRNTLYSKQRDENIEGPQPGKPTKNLEVGSNVTNKQAERFFFRRKLILFATILLISIALVILAVALFWPTKKL